MGTIKDKSILLVDDEPAILLMCQSILKRKWVYKYTDRRYSTSCFGEAGHPPRSGSPGCHAA